jgi:hypothetical protein
MKVQESKSVGATQESAVLTSIPQQHAIANEEEVFAQKFGESFRTKVVRFYHGCGHEGPFIRVEIQAQTRKDRR